MNDTSTRQLLAEKKSILVVLLLFVAVGVAGGFVVISDSEDEYVPVQHDSAPESIESVHDGMNGQGTTSNPYVITNDYELQAINHELDAAYTLGNDIDASGTSSWRSPISTDFAEYNADNETVQQYIPIPSDYQYISVASTGVNGQQSDVTREQQRRLDAANYTVDDDGSLSFVTPPKSDATLSYTVEKRTGFVPITNSERLTPFSGSFDGGGHTITGLYIDRENEDDVGLFGRSTGDIHNVELSKADINGKIGVGILSGAVQGGAVENVSVSGAVTGARDVGGLTGTADGFEERVVVSNTSSSAVISDVNENAGGLVGTNAGRVEQSVATGQVSGQEYVGGIAGQIQLSGVVDESYVSGEVNGSNNVGGITGFGSRNFSADVTDSYVTGQVDGEKNVGALIGNSGSVSESYWDTQATGELSSSTDAIGLNTAQMQGDSAQTNMNLDFQDSWQTVDDGYPVLQQQVEND